MKNTILGICEDMDYKVVSGTMHTLEKNRRTMKKGVLYCNRGH